MLRAKGYACAAVAMLAIALGGASPANAAQTIGQTFGSSGGVPCPAGTYIQTASTGVSYAAPTDGVITSWSAWTGTGGTYFSPLKFKVARLSGGANFTVVGEDSLRTLSTPGESFAVRIPVRQGDVIGFYSVDGGTCPPEYAGFAGGYLAGDPAPGTNAAFTGTSGRQHSISAVLEPDADGDGFGDETQDGCPSDPAAQGACPPPPDTTPPDTTFNDRPDDKTKKRTAHFEFSSSEPGSSFQCKLDDGEFATCSSPDEVKVGKGKHTFAVRAIDAAGNVDPTPATDDWTVKKRKKKHK